jgi:hypothetical protein
MEHIYDHISPKHSSTLFWVEMNTSGMGYLMTSRTDGTMIRPFFKSNHRKRYACSHTMLLMHLVACNCIIIGMDVHVLYFDSLDRF